MNAIITGASRGIGRAVAEIFALHGYDIFLCAKNEARLLQTIDELKVKFPAICVDGKAADLGSKAEAELFGDWLLHNANSIDVLVNNAGSYVPGNVSDEEEGALENMLHINLYSAYHLTRRLMPRMKQQAFGHIFTLCSIASLRAYPGGGAYSISKFALLGFTKNLREELKTHGIKVTAIIPGAIYTDSWKGSGVSLQRIMEPGDLAKMIYAASQLSPQAVPEEIVMRPQLGDL